MSCSKTHQILPDLAAGGEDFMGLYFSFHHQSKVKIITFVFTLKKKAILAIKIVKY